MAVRDRIVPFVHDLVGVPMEKKPFSRDAYTTTYSSWRTVNGRRVGVGPMVTVEPDGLKAGGPTWEND